MHLLVLTQSGRPRRGPRTVPSLLLAGGLVAALAGCGASTSIAATTSTTSVTAAASTATGFTLVDGWVKAAPTGMTAVFGTLTNPTGQDITVVSGVTPAADLVQLHEVVTVGGASKMQPKAGGFVVPAHGRHELQPSGDHIMLMGLKQPIKAGDLVTATLTLKDGSSVRISAIGKDFAGANETYAASGTAASGGMSMSPGSSMTPGETMSGMTATASASS